MPKLYKRLLIVLFGPLVTLSALAQNITASFASTPSICFNDGTLTVNASGGLSPYTYAITAGPIDPNITYPIVLPSGQSTFVNLPHGTYTVVVTDAAGQTGIFTTSVGGTYQFPSLTLSYNGSAIVGVASGGLPAYQYAISSTGSNSGFGPYQASATFSGVCPGQYWVRVRDSCQNIFTNHITIAGYTIRDTLLCVNYSKGTLSVQGLNGRSPYTYTFMSVTNNTGNFTGLPPYFNDILTVSDACGFQAYLPVFPPTLPLYESCPFDGYLTTPGSAAYSSYTFICTDCSPAQTVIGSQLTPSGVDTIFRNIVLGRNYHIVILNSRCGGDTMLYQIVPPIPAPFDISVQPVSCNGIMTFSSAPFDSVVVRDLYNGATVAVNTTGVFLHLPDGNYSVEAYKDSALGTCFSPSLASVNFSVPYFPPYCESLMMDSACHLGIELTLQEYYPVRDHYFLIYNSTDTVFLDPTVPSNNYYQAFYNLTPGRTYSFVSDSGCSIPLTLDSIPAITTSVLSYTPCTGQPAIKPLVTTSLGSSNGFCSVELLFTLFHHDSLVPYTLLADSSIQVSDTGWYQVKWFLRSYDVHLNLFTSDTLCPIDSNWVYVTNSHIPYPFPNSAYICGANGTDTPYYHIYGGQIPYTVEIPGYDTIILTTNTGIFPTRIPGQYGMIVYDDCGISRSITFGIRDTCDGCPIAGMAVPDTLYCSGDTVYLRSTSIGAVAYQWLVNGSAYSTSRDTFFLPDVIGSYGLMLRAYSRSGCIDTASARFDAGTTFSFDLGVDTTYCDTFRRVLYTGVPSTIWSTGDTGSQITVRIEGQYWAVAASRCGVATDTILISSPAILGLYLSADHPSICIDRGDSVVLFASDTLGYSAHTYAWSTGQTDSVVYSSSVIVYTPGPYTVTVSDGPCLQVRSDTIAPRLCDSTSCAQASIGATDSLFCIGDTIHLHSTSLTAVSYQWRINGTLYSTAADTVMIAVAGVYDVFLFAYNGSGCGDSAHIHYMVTEPIVISLGADTVYCDSFSRILYTGIPSTTWSTGQVGPQITVRTPGIYSAMVSGRCGTSSDTVTIRSFAIRGLSISSSGPTVCTDQPDSVALRSYVDSLTQPKVNFVWSSGQVDSTAYSSTIIVHTPGTYQVTVSDSFCAVSRSQSIDSAVCDSGNCVYKIAIPDIFSPNGDGKNELFYVLHKCPVHSFLIHIYNRWGELVYESTDIDKGWDGTYRGAPQPQEDFEWFICIGESINTNINCSNGKLTLIR